MVYHIKRKSATPILPKLRRVRASPDVVNVSFRGVDSEALMLELRDVVAVSNGSACTSSQYAPSHVLLAMGIDEGLIESALRISWGPGARRIPFAEFVAAVRAIRVLHWPIRADAL